MLDSLTPLIRLKSRNPPSLERASRGHRRLHRLHRFPAHPRPFTALDTVPALLASVQAIPGVALAKVERSNLGGECRASLFVRVILDPREAWPNGIAENARHGTFSIEADGKLHLLTAGGYWKGGQYHRAPRFRAGKSAAHAQVVARLSAWVAAYLAECQA